MSKEKFIESITRSYPDKGASIFLGAGVYQGEVVPEARVNLPLRMMTRHGLVTGATGSGKTRTLQLIAEQLSASGVPVFMPDMKGDLSGMAVEGAVNDKLTERAHLLGIPFTPTGFPIELYSLSGKKGAQMRATVTEFGPVLLSKVLELNEVQSGVLSILFKYADDKDLPIVDLNDLKKVLNYLTEGAGAAEIKSDYGKISGATASTILRKLVALEQQGVAQLFGEKSFDINDLFEKVDGRGVISLLNVSDVQHQPAIFSTFMLALLAEIYQALPEAGDLDKPKLVFFLDEAHLLFKDAPKAFMDQIEQVIRLIRSKGVGIFFCTQVTQDVPASVLSQLGNRVHHVIRAFTPNDVKALKETIKTFPRSDFYDMEQQFTQLGIGQAFITVLNEKGIPTETVVTHLVPPTSLMGPLPDQATTSVAVLSGRSDHQAAYQPLEVSRAMRTLSTHWPGAEGRATTGSSSGTSRPPASNVRRDARVSSGGRGTGSSHATEDDGEHAITAASTGTTRAGSGFMSGG